MSLQSETFQDGVPRIATAPFAAAAETQFALAVLASGCLGVIPLGDALGHR